MPFSGWLQTAFFPFNNRRDGKEKASFWPRGFFFLTTALSASNLHLRGRETIFCYHSISLNLRTAGDIFHDSLNSHHSKEIPADLSLLPSSWGLKSEQFPECHQPGSTVCGWVCDLSCWNIFFFFFFFEGERERERNRGIGMNLFQSILPFLEIKGKSHAVTAKDLNPS